MKNLIFILSFLLFTPFLLFPQSNWYWQNPKPNGIPYYSSSFINSETGYVSSSDYTLKRTTDKGVSWLTISTSVVLNKIQFLNENVGFAFCDDGIYKTVNGGYNWQISLSGEFFWYPNLSFIDENTGFVATSRIQGGPIPYEYTRILKTTNGGENWNAIFAPMSTNPSFVNSIHFKDSNTGYAFGDRIYYTSNSGVNWDLTYLSYTQKSISMVNDSVGYTVGLGGTFYKTTDGVNWNSGLTSSNYTLNSCYFFNESSGIAVGNYGTILKTTDNGLNWQEYSLGYINHLTSLDFFDSNTGYVFGVGGFYAKTTNSGENWIIQTEGHLKDFNSICFLNKNTGFCAGQNAIYRTLNSGNNWFRIYEDTSVFNKISILDSNNIFITGKSGLILKSSDLGLNWEYLVNGTKVDLYDIKFLNNNTGFAVGNNFNDIATILKTTNAGKEWNRATNYLTENNLRCIYFVNDNLGFAGGSNGLFRTTNSGENWFPWNSAGRTNINSIYFPSSQIGYFCSDYATGKSTNYGNQWFVTTYNGWNGGNSIYFVNETLGYKIVNSGIGFFSYTTDGGYNWIHTYDPITFPNNLYSFNFINKDTGFIAGAFGTIMKTTNGGGTITSIISNFNESNLKYELLQNYPNPFNPITKISYSLPNSEIVYLKIYDVLGKEVVNIINGELKSPGIYSINLSGDNLSSGIYFYQLTAGKFSLTKRMVLIK